MKVAGVISEYNPFHTGHGWMIEELRRRGYDTVVCVMSGSFVQRAEPALLPASVRAEAALLGGADLVFRLPTPWAISSAERFSRAGVALVSALGCVDTLCFGAETPDIMRLCAVASLLQTEEFRLILKEELAQGVSFAFARAIAAERILAGAGEVLRSPNNILAVEYCKALQQGFDWAPLAGQPEKNALGIGATLPQPLALPRQGAGHDGEPAEGFASASWLRRVAEGYKAEGMKPYLNPLVLPKIEQAFNEGACIDAARWETGMLARLKGKSAEHFLPYEGSGEGLAQRLALATQKATTLEELYSSAKSKRFAHSRVRRVALAAALELPPFAGTDKEATVTLPDIPPFLHLLAASEKGLAFLKKANEKTVLPLSTSLSKLGKLNGACKVTAKTEAAVEDLYSFCQKNPAAGGGAYTQPVKLMK